MIESSALQTESTLQQYHAAFKMLEGQVRLLKDLYERLPDTIQETTHKPAELLQRLAPLTRCRIRSEGIVQ